MANAETRNVQESAAGCSQDLTCRRVLELRGSLSGLKSPQRPGIARCTWCANLESAGVGNRKWLRSGDLFGWCQARFDVRVGRK